MKDKKRTVEIFKASSSKQSRFGDDFKFYPENYTYQMKMEDGNILLIRNDIQRHIGHKLLSLKSYAEDTLG